MAALAPIEDLEKVKKELDAFKEKYPEAYGEIGALFSVNRRVGYKNIVRMIYGETPEELKQ